MPKLSMVIRHSLSQEDALQRTQGLLGEVKQKHGGQISNLRENWSGNKATFSFTVAGFDVSGTLEVKASYIRIEGNLPLAAALFKDQIESTIRDRAQERLT